MTKPNQFVKSLKNINKSINSLLERNLNKLKFDNLKILASNNRIIFTFVAVFVFFISYLLLPTFYKHGDISKELKNKLLNKFELDFTLTKNLKYNFFPQPHFIIKGSSITQNQKNISYIKTLKIYISLNNLFSLKNIKVNDVILENANFELENKNINFFLKLLNNNFLNTSFKIKNSNIFFRNSKSEVLFINKINSLKYYYDSNESKNVLYSENEIFNTPYSLEVIDHKDEKKIYTKLKLDNVKLEIENIFNYNDNIKLGLASIFFDNTKSLISYKTNKNFLDFEYYDELDKQKFFYNAKLNFKPFYSTFEGNVDEINVSYLFDTNAIITELLKTEIFNSKKIDFKLNIKANKIQKNRNLINLLLNSKIQDGQIDVDGTEIEWKDNSIIKLTDTLIFVKDGKLFLDGKSNIKIIDYKNIYKFLLTPKNFRKQIKTINFNFSYGFDEKVIILSDIMIDGKYNKKVNERLNNIYFQGSDMQNKIFIKNMMNNLIKAYAG